MKTITSHFLHLWLLPAIFLDMNVGITGVKYVLLGKTNMQKYLSIKASNSSYNNRRNIESLLCIIMVWYDTYLLTLPLYCHQGYKNSNLYFRIFQVRKGNQGKNLKCRLTATMWLKCINADLQHVLKIMFILDHTHFAMNANLHSKKWVSFCVNIFLFLLMIL